MVSILTFHNLDTGWPWIPQRLINTFPAGRRVCSLVWIVWVCYLWFPLQVFLIPFLVTCQVYEKHQKYLHVCVGFGSNEDYNPRTLQCNFTKMYNVETVHYFPKKISVVHEQEIKGFNDLFPGLLLSEMRSTVFRCYLCDVGECCEVSSDK